MIRTLAVLALVHAAGGFVARPRPRAATARAAPPPRPPSTPSPTLRSADILRCRLRTSGIVSKEFNYKSTPFEIYDVGGQRAERRKWIYHFDNVDAIVFVAAISEYNQVMTEDRSKNRLQEAIDLFGQVVNSHLFAKTDVILFLNKKDLFEEKIKTVDPAEWFPDYTGGCNFAKAEEYFKKRFEAQVEGVKAVYKYTTCATDTGNVGVVFDAMQSIFLSRSAMGGGMFNDEMGNEMVQG